jgi:hypothetical protein
MDLHCHENLILYTSKINRSQSLRASMQLREVVGWPIVPASDDNEDDYGEHDGM